MMKRFLLFIVFLIAAGGTALIAATFGKATIGSVAQSAGTIESIILCGKFTASTSGTATNITWYTTNTTAEKASKAAIYEYVDATNAGALRAASSEDTAEVDAAWRTGTITYDLVGGTDYYLCGWGTTAGGTHFLNYETTGGISVTDSAAYGTFPDPLVEAGTGTLHLSIYVTYTETATGKPAVIGGGIF